MAFVIFLIAATAEVNHPPFDLVEAEQELVGGFNTEYSSIRFALFFLAEFMNTVTMSALIVTMFLGGPSGPMFGPEWLQTWILPLVWFFGKLVLFLFAFLWFRGTLPRLRYDQLMDLGWKVLIPVTIVWIAVEGVMVRPVDGAHPATAHFLLQFVAVRAQRGFSRDGQGHPS